MALEHVLPFLFLKEETEPCTDLEKQRPPKKPANCFWLVMWKQEPGQLLQNTLLTLISQTGTDLFWLYVRVHTPTRTDARGKLRSSGLQPPALTQPPPLQPTAASGGGSAPDDAWRPRDQTAGPAANLEGDLPRRAANAGRTWKSREEETRVYIHQTRQLNELPFSRAVSAPSANLSEFVTINFSPPSY